MEKNYTLKKYLLFTWYSKNKIWKSKKEKTLFFKKKPTTTASLREKREHS